MQLRTKLGAAGDQRIVIMISRMIRAVTDTGAIRGKVTLKKVRTGPAPSIAAAMNGSVVVLSPMPLSPASVFTRTNNQTRPNPASKEYGFDRGDLHRVSNLL